MTFQFCRIGAQGQKPKAETQSCSKHSKNAVSKLKAACVLSSNSTHKHTTRKTRFLLSAPDMKHKTHKTLVVHGALIAPDPRLVLLPPPATSAKFGAAFSSRSMVSRLCLLSVLQVATANQYSADSSSRKPLSNYSTLFRSCSSNCHSKVEAAAEKKVSSPGGPNENLRATSFTKFVFSFCRCQVWTVFQSCPCRHSNHWTNCVG